MTFFLVAMHLTSRIGSRGKTTAKGKQQLTDFLLTSS